MVELFSKSGSIERSSASSNGALKRACKPGSYTAESALAARAVFQTHIELHRSEVAPVTGPRPSHCQRNEDGQSQSYYITVFTVGAAVETVVHLEHFTARKAPMKNLFPAFARCAKSYSGSQARVHKSRLQYILIKTAANWQSQVLGHLLRSLFPAFRRCRVHFEVPEWKPYLDLCPLQTDVAQHHIRQSLLTKDTVRFHDRGKHHLPASLKCCASK